MDRVITEMTKAKGDVERQLRKYIPEIIQECMAFAENLIQMTKMSDVNSEIVERHLNPGERALYVFVAQKNDNPFNILGTAVVALTNKRILIGQKRVLWGYNITSITPDMFNDLKINSGLIWGKVRIDTIKEHIVLKAKSLFITVLPS